jgi:hydroxymethylbilane synthase
MTHPIRIGTRASPLALAQTHEVLSRLMATHDLPETAFAIVPMVASGDKIQDRALAEIGGKALWTKELDAALAEGEIDIAVHSMKDVETLRPPQFHIAAMLERADARDRLIVNKNDDRLIGASSIATLKQGAVVGTSSPRRRAQLLRLRPDLKIVLLRGNVATRLAKVERGEVDATLLAAAGLDRLGMADIGTPIPLETMLPAPAQGAIGIEVRADDVHHQALVSAVNHAPTYACIMAERALLAGLSGDCRSAIAALAVMDGARVTLKAELYSPDGQEAVHGQCQLFPGDSHGPHALTHSLLTQASPELRGLFYP